MTYAELQAQIALWTHRDDLGGVLDTFIILAEERINRKLRVRQMEAVLAETPISANLIIPADNVVDVKSLWIAGRPDDTLKPQSLETVLNNGSDGEPALYAWQGTSLRFDGGGSVEGVVYERVPALATASTNWLADLHPSVYLFGTLSEAAQYAGDDPSVWESRFQQALEEVAGNDQRRSGPLVSRAR